MASTIQNNANYLRRWRQLPVIVVSFEMLALIRENTLDHSGLARAANLAARIW